MPKIKSFLKKLQSYKNKNSFNPWQEFNKDYDINEATPKIRAFQLETYFAERLNKASLILLGEAPSYQGARFTGIPFTSERILLGYHKTVPKEFVFSLKAARTSNPESPFLQEIQKKIGFNEPSATYLWTEIVENNLNPYQIVFWNIFPFHPFKDKPLSNRTPIEEELLVGLEYFQEFKEIFPKAKVIAVGKKSWQTLKDAGYYTHLLRHPANGGGNAFKTGFKTFLKENNFI